MNNNINISDVFFNEVEKKIKSKRNYFKILDNFILPLLITFLILSISSSLVLLFSGVQINKYIEDNDFNTMISNNLSLINYLKLWSLNNYVSIILNNISSCFGYVLSIVLSIELFVYIKWKEIVDNYKKSMICFTIFYVLFFSIFCSYSSNVSLIPTGLDEQNMTFKFFSNSHSQEIFQFLIFKNNENYNSFLSGKFSGDVSSGNYFVYFITIIVLITSLSFISIFYFCLTFLINIRSKKYITLKRSDIDNLNNKINESIKQIENVKEINKNVHNEILNYYEKQRAFFIENKNKAKKIPYNISFTQEIDLNEKWSKKLVQIETDDKEGILPLASKKGIEKLKNKRKIDDLFLKDTNERG